MKITRNEFSQLLENVVSEVIDVPSNRFSKEETTLLKKKFPHATIDKTSLSFDPDNHNYSLVMIPRKELYVFMYGTLTGKDKMKAFPRNMNKLLGYVTEMKKRVFH